MKRNIAYKADGTEETGKKIIDALMAIGGRNQYIYNAVSVGYYFFIDNYGNIDSCSKLPFCYELKSLDEQKNIADAIDQLNINIMDLMAKL